MQTRYQKLISQQPRDDDSKKMGIITMSKDQIALALSKKNGSVQSSDVNLST